MAQVTEIQRFPPQKADEEVAHERDFVRGVPAGLLSLEAAIIAILDLVLPDEILLGTVRDGRLRVRVPIRVRFRREDQHVVAEAAELDEFGFGANLSEALADLQDAIGELYFTLEREQGRLGPDLRRVWTVLQQKLMRRL